ncbi:484_t:CDS:2, partial [Entrophospora sp. SA101]
ARPLPDGIYVSLYDGDNDNFHLDARDFSFTNEITNARRGLYLISITKESILIILSKTHEQQINIIRNRGSPEQRTVELQLKLEYVNSGGETFLVQISGDK